MRKTITRTVPALAAAAVVLAAAPAAGASVRPVHDPVPIRPNQLFMGLVNNHPPGTAVIAVACAVGATTGHPIGNQPVEVKPATTVGTVDVGNTGSAGDRITAALANTSAANTIVAKFTSYFVPENIPTTLTVPCSGKGKMLFIPAPHSASARTAVLPVTFGNITVGQH